MCTINNGDTVKKILLLLLTCLLGACSKAITIEEDAQLIVGVENETYGEGLQELWNETYPEHADALTYTVIDENEVLAAVLNGTGLTYDVFWIKDEDVATAIDRLYEIPSRFYENFEATIREDYSATINSLKNCYYALGADGFLYAVDQTKLEEENIDPQLFNQFETMIESKQENLFYYYDNQLFLLPLLSGDTNYFPGKNNTSVNFTGEAFKISLNDYLTIKEGLSLTSDPAQFDQWFINRTYLSGLIGPWMQVEESEAVNDFTLHFQKLPTINGHQLKTLADSYGYVINADTLYPNASLKLLELMHSQKGMQLYADNTSIIPLILDEEMENYTLNKPHQAEKISAMNASMQTDLIGLKENETVEAMGIFDEDAFRKLLDKACTDNADTCTDTLAQANMEWIKTQAGN